MQSCKPQAGLWFAFTAALVVVADQVTKWLAVAHLTDAFAAVQGEGDFGARLQQFLWFKHPSRGAPVSVFDDFWHFRYVENPGAAWGFLAQAESSFRTPFFVIVSLAAMTFILLYFRRTLVHQKLLRFALALVFGGAVGNFLDRIRLGYVIDFIDWHWYTKATWPTFNVADSAISVGVTLMFIDMFLQKPQGSDPAFVAAPATRKA